MKASRDMEVMPQMRDKGTSDATCWKTDWYRDEIGFGTTAQ